MATGKVLPAFSTMLRSINNAQYRDSYLRLANAKLAIRTIEQNRDPILGLKIRVSRGMSGDDDVPALRIAREAADAVKLPLMIHAIDTTAPLAQILQFLKKQDSQIRRHI